jgi:hypothetical protein
MIAPEAGLSVRRQCALLEIARSSFCYRPRPETVEELDLLKWLDRISPTTQPPAAGGALSGGGFGGADASVAGELRALIGVEDAGFAELDEGLVRRGCSTTP